MYNENILIDLVEKSKAMLKNLRRKGIISEKELKCFSFEYKKATNLGKPYLLPKIQKVFLGKVVLKICSKFTGEHPYRSVISINLLCNFIEITL